MNEPIGLDLLITGGTVLTMDPDNRLIEGGAVAVHKNTIVAVGPAAELRAAYVPERVLDGTDKAILPGLVDTYGHGVTGERIYTHELWARIRREGYAIRYQDEL